MEWYWTLLLLLGSILFLMFVGLPVGIAFILVNTAAAIILFGRFGANLQNLEQLGIVAGLSIQLFQRQHRVAVVALGIERSAVVLDGAFVVLEHGARELAGP